MNIEELIASLPDKERFNINKQKFTQRIPNVQYAKGGHLFDGRTEDTQQLNDATYVAPIRVPKLGETKKVTGGTPMGNVGLLVGQMLEQTPEWVPFQQQLRGLGQYLQTDLPTEEEQKQIEQQQRIEAQKRNKEHPYISTAIAGLQGFKDGFNAGILNEAFMPIPTHTSRIKAEISPYSYEKNKGYSYDKNKGFKIFKDLESKAYIQYISGDQELYPGQFKMLDEKLLGYSTFLNEKSKQILEQNVKRLAAMRPDMAEDEIRAIVQKEANKRYNIYPRETFTKAGISDDFEGLHFDKTGNIAIVENSSINPIIIETHETRHSLQDLLPRTKAEDKILKDAYSDLEAALKESKSESFNSYSRAKDEWETLNSDARLQALGYNTSARVDMNLQNKILDKLSDEDIIEAMKNADGYGKNLVEYYERKGEVPKEKIDAWREAMKRIGIYTSGISTISSPFISTKENNKANGGNLNKYSKGTEYDLSNKEILDLIKKGYKISYL